MLSDSFYELNSALLKLTVNLNKIVEKVYNKNVHKKLFGDTAFYQIPYTCARTQE